MDRMNNDRKSNMQTNKDDLINQLTQDLQPVKVQMLPWQRTLVWFPLLLAAVAGISWMLDDYRPGFLSQLTEHLRFQIEMATALVVSAVALYATFSGFVPGQYISKPVKWLFGIAVTLLIVSLIWSFFDATPPASREGLRPFCELEALAYGIIALIILLFINRKGLPEINAQKRFIYGFSVGLIPALIMQIACMYEPAHAVFFHYIPGLIVAGLGILLSPRIFR